MLIKSLDINYFGEKVITDIDDCIMFTSKRLNELGIDARSFWFNDDIYKKNKDQVFRNCELTAWGKELLNLTKTGVITDFEFLTSSTLRNDILLLFDVDRSRIRENMDHEKKIKYLNSVYFPCIYVDNKSSVINKITNDFVFTVIFPFK